MLVTGRVHEKPSREKAMLVRECLIRQSIFHAGLDLNRNSSICNWLWKSDKRTLVKPPAVLVDFSPAWRIFRNTKWRDPAPKKCLGFNRQKSQGI
jgi:hypothetical protein